MNNLDKNSPVPLYYQLYSNLLSDIQDGTLMPGDMIPPEMVLMKRFDISRATVRHALNNLAREGYLIRAKSRGTIVKDKPTVGYRDRVKGFYALSSINGAMKFSTKVLASCVMDPPKRVQEALQLRDGDKVFYLKRVRSLQGTPHIYVEDWLDYRRCPGIEKLDFTELSLYETLEQRYGVSPCTAERTFECYYAELEEQLTELKVNKNKALLCCTSYVTDENNRPLEYYVAIVNGKYTVHE